LAAQSTYTGTWAHGGGPPTLYDGPKDLATQLSRGIRSDQRRVNVEAAAAAQALQQQQGLARIEPLTPPPAVASTPRQKSGQADANPLRSKFIAFAVFGKGASVMAEATRRPSGVLMDSKGFAKLCKESDIMGGSLDLTRVDLCFTKACDKVRRLLCASRSFAMRHTPGSALCGLSACRSADADNFSAATPRQISA
jgi:p25-alpha